MSEILVRRLSWSCHTRGTGNRARRKSVKILTTAVGQAQFTSSIRVLTGIEHPDSGKSLHAKAIGVPTTNGWQTQSCIPRSCYRNTLKQL